MAYTNRKFTWDFDSLKRFYERYVVKWFNSDISLTNSQKLQARTNIGINAANTPYNNANSYLTVNTTQDAIDALSEEVKGEISVYDTRELPAAASGYYNITGSVVTDNTTNYYNKVTLDDEYVDKYLQIYQFDNYTVVNSYVLLYASDGTTIKEAHKLNITAKCVLFSTKIESGDKLAISCSKDSVPVIKFISSNSLEAKLVALDARLSALEDHLDNIL